MATPPSGPVLGIESSCDETAVAVFDGRLRSHVLHSQVAMHAEYGGVVPELASRDHVRRIVPLIRQALAEAEIGVADLSAVSYTAGPGLIGALMVGASTAAGLALARDLPLIPVHHMEAHLLAPLLEDPAPEFPFLALLVSGGHTLLVSVEGIGRYEVLGESLDDAVGEAFDKVAKLLGLPYPGGPALAKLAESGTPGRYKFPRPMTDRPGLDFSFSGLKTAVLTALPKDANDGQKADIARGFEDAVVQTLLIKCERALEQTGHQRWVVAGGVAANLRLRAALQDSAKHNGTELFFPRREFCTDNAAMVAYTGWARIAEGRDAGEGLQVRARWNLARTDGARLMDTVQIRGLKVETIIGVHAWEKKLKRSIAIDIELATDAAAAAKSDSIDNAIDYQAVADAAVAFTSENQFQLIETLADKLAAHLMETFACPYARLTVHKPGAVAKTQDISVSATRGSKS